MELEALGQNRTSNLQNMRMSFSLNIFYFNLVRYTYKYIQVTLCKRIRTKAGSLCYSSPSNNQM